MKRVALDQGLAARAAIMLRDQGWDAIHVREMSMQEAADGDILEFAKRESRTVLTLDRDFPQILAVTGASLPSVVLIRQERLRAIELVHLITSTWREHELAIDAGCVLTVSPRGTRTRALPLR